MVAKYFYTVDIFVVVKKFPLPMVNMQMNAVSS